MKRIPLYILVAVAVLSGASCGSKEHEPGAPGGVVGQAKPPGQASPVPANPGAPVEAIGRGIVNPPEAVGHVIERSAEAVAIEKASPKAERAVPQTASKE